MATTGGWTSSACGEAAAGGAVVGALAGLTDGLSLYAEGAAEVGGATACEVECSALIDTGAPNDATTGTISSGAKVEPTITSTTSSDITTTTLTENVGNDLAQTSTGLSNAESESNFVPNPYGKLGGPLHQGVVSDIASDISSRDLYAVKEFQVGGRFADVAAFDRPPELGGSPMEFYQVGRLTSAGLPVAREIYAAGDIIDALGIDVIFVPYNV